MTTRMERETVVARCEGVEVNIEQSISGKAAEHWWKLV
jgi:hypothetical protein